jgi:midasin (ATPase involved in ribosome maturation)
MSPHSHLVPTAAAPPTHSPNQPPAGAQILHAAALHLQAVAQGRWVLVEDVNLAPPEVLAALVPLLERRTLNIAARAESVAAAPGFQFIATVTSAPGGRCYVVM